MIFCTELMSGAEREQAGFGWSAEKLFLLVLPYVLLQFSSGTAQTTSLKPVQARPRMLFSIKHNLLRVVGLLCFLGHNAAV